MNLATLTGNTAPLKELAGRLSESGSRFDIHFGQVSPQTGDGETAFTADFNHGSLVWQIYGPVGAHAHKVYHELLHVELYDIYRAEWLVATGSANDEMRRAIRWFNNDLDHSILVSEEINAYPEAESFWRDDLGRLLNMAAAFDETSKKLSLLRGWMVLASSLPNASITALYREKLTAIGALDAANRLSDAVRIAARDKKEIFSAFRDALGFRYLEPRDFEFVPSGYLRVLT